MLVEGEGSPQNDLDSFRGHFACWVPYYGIVFLWETLASWVPYYDLNSFRGHLLIWSNIFSLLKFFIKDFIAFYVGSRNIITIPY